MSESSKHNVYAIATCYCPLLALAACVLACGQSLSVELAAGISLGLALRVLLQVGGRLAADRDAPRASLDVVTLLALGMSIAGFVIDGTVGTILVSVAPTLLAGLVAYRFANAPLLEAPRATAPSASSIAHALGACLPVAFFVAVAKLAVSNCLTLQGNGFEPNMEPVLLALPLLTVAAGLMAAGRRVAGVARPSLEESLLAASVATFLYAALITGLDSRGQLQLLFYNGSALAPTSYFYLVFVAILIIEGLLLAAEKSSRTYGAHDAIVSFGRQYALSERELEVLGALSRRETVGQTATRLGISSATVATYRRRVLDKCGASSTGELMGRLAKTLDDEEGRGHGISCGNFAKALGLAVLLTACTFPLGLRGSQRSFIEVLGRLVLLIVIARRAFLPRRTSSRQSSSQVRMLALLAGLLMGSGSDILLNFRDVTMPVQGAILMLYTLACMTVTLARLDAPFLAGLLLGLTALAGIGIYLPAMTLAAGCLACVAALIAWQREETSSDARPLNVEALLAKSGLTPAETRVAMLLGDGLSVASAADELGISRSTVATHRKSIYRKLDIHSQHELILCLSGHGA